VNLLLDTQAWLWFHLGDARLNQRAREHITDPANSKFISPASYWEIAIKIRIGSIVSSDSNLAAYEVPLIW
jgi:PIN domain nuclease of toxin-antitoxin system